MYRLVLIRHGESVWNQANKFTGWTDVALSDKGVEEAMNAGKLLKAGGYQFDLAFTSVLKRANDTLMYVLKELATPNIETKYSWRLNERHYGALQGLNKDETRAKYGAEQVHIWRRSADVKPPLLDKTDPRFPGFDAKYRDLTPDQLPQGENLLDTIDRVLPYWHSDIKPALLKGRKIVIAAHGNSLRALVKYLDNISTEAIMEVEIPTGKPLIYELDANLRPIKHYYL